MDLQLFHITNRNNGKEELLATDDLFIQYFNAFLALPSFPEPLFFNKETGGFEVLNDAKQALAKEIKEAVRAGRRRRKIYRPVRNHSYSTIPLIPMLQPALTEEKEIDTSFTVQTLNKEQGIEWIKAQRLPAFLNSDFYIEFRLARILSQVQTAQCELQERGSGVSELVTMKIDYTSPQAKEALEEAEPEEEEDEAEVMMRDLYVSMGKASSTTTEAWVSQAKSALDTTTTTSSVRPTPSLTNSYPSSRPTSGRPHSGRPHRDASQSSRVGFLLPDSYRTTQDQENADQTTHVHKPMTSRSGDELCVVAEKLEEGTRGGVVYSLPRPPTTESEESEDDDKDDRSVQSEASKDSVMDEGDDTPIVFHSVDELGAVIVGTVLKEALAEATGQAEESIRTMPHIQQLYPSAKYHHFTKATLERVECLLDDKSTHSTKVQESLPPPLIPERSTESRKLNPKDEDSDDSLLNSDDDYEQDRDSFFRKTKNKKTYSLLTRKGFEQFKTFLEGSVGQKNWTLWVDIERAKLIEDPDDQKTYLGALRDCYDKKGSQLELSGETKRELGLTEPSHWNLDTLIVAQTRMAEPLLLYWAPRFLIQQTSHVEPDKHYLYHHQRLIQPHPHPYPNPPVIKVLPLRPKTCMPRMGVPSSTSPCPSHSPTPVLPHKLDYTQESGGEQFLSTAPPTGMKRTYSLPDMYVKAQQNIPITQEPVKRDPVKRTRAASAQPRSKTPKELITARMSVTPRRTRPPSAPGLMSSKRLSSGSRANSSTQELWERTSSVSQQDSLHHTTDQPDAASEAMARRSSTASDVYSEVSTFAGGRRMEGLLQALAAEKTAGGFLRKSLLAHDNQLWLRCLDFWQELQQYHQIFYAPVLNPYKLQNKAKNLYSTYIVRGAPQSVACSQPIADDIHLHIDPPYEELFDAAEEHVLSILYEAWTQSLSADLGLFGKVELVEVRRHLEAKSKYVVSLQQRGIIKERVETIEDPMEGYQDPVYDDTLLERIPNEFIDFTLEKLIHNRMELEHFRQFLADHYASMDLMCWMDLEAFRRTPHTEEKRREARAKDIRVKYLNKKYFFGPNSPAGKEGQEKVMSVGGGWGKLLDDRPPTSSLLEAQKYVRQRLEKKWLPLFLATEGFADRQRPQSGMDDVVEDVLIQRKKKSQAIWKMLESKWVSSSKDILTFRKALGNPVTSLQFRKFVSIKGDHFENDVLFWQEVQKYKELCHLHSDRSLVHQKTSNLINCFIDSPIPPSLQIDITQEMAEKLLDRKLEATPYLFRESQLTVFRVLFSHWSDFCIYRSQLADDKVIPTLERHRRKARAEEKRKQKEQEERKEREAARRQQLGLPPDGDQTENQYDPFGGRAGSDGEEEGDGDEEGKHKDALSWSYSQYMEALDQEEVLNETNTSTFSSLMEVKQQLEAVSQTHVSPADSGSEEGEGSKEASSGKRSIKRKALNGVEKGQVPTSDTGSQTDPKPKKTVRVISPKSKQPTPDDVSRSSSPPSQKSPTFLPSPPNADKPTHTRRRSSATDSRK